MSRSARLASSLGALAFLLFATSATAAADTAPSPPPGGLTVQPISASAGSSSQPESNTTVSTGKAGVSSTDGGTAAHCGVSASTGGRGSAAEPAQVGTSGTTAPSGCTSTSTGGSGAGAGSNAGAGSTNAQARDKTTGEVPGSTLVAAAGLAGSGLGAGFNLALLLGLLLLLTLFLLLIGFAAGRRRQAHVNA